MTYDELVASVGATRYRLAREAAWKNRWPKDLELVPHQLHDLWDDDAPLLEKLALALRVLCEMPCYALTMPLKWYYDDFGPAERALLWDTLRDILDGEDELLVEAVLYSQWCNFLDDADLVDEAWAELTRDAPDLRARRVLRISGPVPATLKDPWIAWRRLT